jgi:bifunctional non-homologous end joining protein LigD
MHIAVPLAARYEAWQVKTLGELISTMLHQRLPARTTLEARPEQRKGRIYLDHTRNSRGQALAAAYSVRAWRGATVSTPLKWSEVRRGLDPARFTIETMAERLAKVGDLWAPVMGPGIDLAACVDRLSRVERVQRS